MGFLRVIYDLEFEVAYHFNKNQTWVTQGPKVSLEVPNNVMSLFI